MIFKFEQKMIWVWNKPGQGAISCLQKTFLDKFEVKTSILENRKTAKIFDYRVSQIGFLNLIDQFEIPDVFDKNVNYLFLLDDITTVELVKEILSSVTTEFLDFKPDNVHFAVSAMTCHIDNYKAIVIDEKIWDIYNI